MYVTQLSHEKKGKEFPPWFVSSLTFVSGKSFRELIYINNFLPFF